MLPHSGTKRYQTVNSVIRKYCACNKIWNKDKRKKEVVFLPNTLYYKQQDFKAITQKRSTLVTQRWHEMDAETPLTKITITKSAAILNTKTLTATYTHHITPCSTVMQLVQRSPITTVLHYCFSPVIGNAKSSHMYTYRIRHS